MSPADWKLTDVIVPPAPGSLMRTAFLSQIGKFRISRRDAELYSVQITFAGAWGRIRVYTGLGRQVFRQQSTFPGSFWLSGGCEDGIIVHLESKTTAPSVSVNFREADLALV
jgi:hypothetical protein